MKSFQSEVMCSFKQITWTCASKEQFFFFQGFFSSPSQNTGTWIDESLVLSGSAEGKFKLVSSSLQFNGVITTQICI